MFSVAPIFALALTLQAQAAQPASEAPMATAAQGEPTPAPAPAVAPAPDDDPIGALVTQSQAEEAAATSQPPATPAPAPAPAPTMTAPVPAPAPVLPPIGTSRPAQAGAPTVNDGMDEDGEDPRAGLPAGPQPYTSLPRSTMRSRPGLFTQPMVRLPPRSQGALDGGWLLSRTDGYRLYGFQFNDLGNGQEVEGAFRDLRRDSASMGSGPVTSVGSDAGGVTIRFYEKGKSRMSVVSLRPAGSGGWTGQIQTDGTDTPVIMKRE